MMTCLSCQKISGYLAFLWSLLLVLCVAGTASVSQASDSPTLDIIRERQSLRCVVDQNALGFAYRDDNGQAEGFNVAFCRAVAAAILGDGQKVSVVPTTPLNRFTMLSSGNAEMLSRSSSWTLSRDATLGLDFVATTYFSGQGFLVHREDGVTSLDQLDGSSVCIPAGTTLEGNLNDYNRSRNLSMEFISMEQIDDAVQAFAEKRCDSFTADTSYLASTVALLHQNRGYSDSKNPDHVILPQVISKEPLSVAVREGDSAFADIVRWVIFGLITAEELGVTSENVKELARDSSRPQVRRLLGTEGAMGEQLGLESGFMVHVIGDVGNYGEIFERYLAPLGLPRLKNALYRDGGLLYAPPFR